MKKRKKLHLSIETLRALDAGTATGGDWFDSVGPQTVCCYSALCPTIEGCTDHTCPAQTCVEV